MPCPVQALYYRLVAMLNEITSSRAVTGPSLGFMCQETLLWVSFQVLEIREGNLCGMYH